MNQQEMGASLGLACVREGIECQLLAKYQSYLLCTIQACIIIDW